MNLRESLSRLIEGDVFDDDVTRRAYSRDTSVFERTPSLVVFPKNAEDVANVVRFVHEAKQRGETLSIAPRSAGTDMTGGPLTDSIALVFTRYMNRIHEVRPDAVVAEPGVFYRDLEKATLEKSGKLVPSYPASREYCALGGMVGNNSGGELTLRYGKTDRYVRSLETVLSDGSRATFRALSRAELAQKEREQSLEGAIYRSMRSLLESNAAAIEAARPSVSKNSAGYALWNIVDKERGTFDLTKLLTGSQGTLALVTQAELSLVALKPRRAMLVIFLSDIDILPEVVRRVLALEPESFESYDDQTFRLAVRFFPQIVKHFGIFDMLRLAFSFLPELWLVLTGGVPKLVLMAEFAEESAEEALEKARLGRGALHGLPVSTKIARSEAQAAKYWSIRRESFALLRKNLKGLYAAPFIDDIVVHPKDYPQFIPELNALLRTHRLLYTVAGHIGDANFHIIPLMDLAKKAARGEITKLQEELYRIVAKYRGSITGEHNDGIVRTPYLPIMYGDKMCALFSDVKKIFDPLGILNPGKKTGGTVADINRSMLHHV